MGRAAKGDNRFLFTNDAIEKIPFSDSWSTPRYYDTLLPVLMIRVGKSKKQFYVNYTDPVSRKAEREYVGTWGEMIEVVTQRGNKKVVPIDVDAIRHRAMSKQVELTKLTNDNISPKLAQKKKTEAAKIELAKGLTLRQAWEEYLAQHTKLSEPSREDIRQTFAHVDDVIDQPLKEFCDPNWVMQRFVTIYERKSVFAHGGSPAMAYKFLIWLKAILNMVDDEGALLGKNPVTVAEVRLRKRKNQYPKPARRKSIIPSDERFLVHNRLSTLEDNLDFLAADFIKLLLYTGLRDEAARTLKWSYINFDRGFAWVYVDSRREKMIILPLSDRAMEVLRERLARLKQHVEWPEIRKAGWVFPVKHNGEWGFLKESKKFFQRLDLPTNMKMVQSDKWRRPVRDKASNAEILVTHPESGEVIYKQASPQDFRRMVASYAKNHAGVAGDYIDKMLTHSDRETLAEGYIVDEDDAKIRELRACFNQLATFVDAEREVTTERMEKLFANQRLTQTSLPSGRAKPAPLSPRSKHTPKTRPSVRTSSRP